METKKLEDRIMILEKELERLNEDIRRQRV
jgi:uncharacterized small protein (DUF1192 family)